MMEFVSIAVVDEHKVPQTDRLLDFLIRRRGPVIMAFVRSAYTHTDLLKHALTGFEQGKQEIDQAIANIRQTLNGTAARAPSVKPTRPREVS